MSVPSALSPDQEADIQKLQQMSNNLRTLQNQQMQLEGQKVEIARTLKTLKEVPEGKDIFRQTGQILFKADLAETIKDLDDKLELLEIRIKQGSKQFEDYQKATQSLEQKIKGYLKI